MAGEDESAGVGAAGAAESAESGSGGGGRFWILASAVLLLFALSDVATVKEANADVSAAKGGQQAPMFASKLMGPTIKVLYCYS